LLLLSYRHYYQHVHDIEGSPAVSKLPLAQHSSFPKILLRAGQSRGRRGVGRLSDCGCARQKLKMGRSQCVSHRVFANRVAYITCNATHCCWRIPMLVLLYLLLTTPHPKFGWYSYYCSSHVKSNLWRFFFLQITFFGRNHEVSKQIGCNPGD
jgi:hypothetical protein